jgi:hypothetical protein
VKRLWYKRSGERVSKQHVREAQARAVHAKRFGHPTSPHAVPGMSAQPLIADSIERMTLSEFAAYSGLFNFTLRQ